MKSLIILTDEQSEFLVSRADPGGYTSMDVEKIMNYFKTRDFSVRVCKFSELDLRDDFKGVYFLYQSSETAGGFYKRYIESLIYFLEQKGAITLPEYEYLRAHHDKVSMEIMRSGFSDSALKTLESRPYGSWVDALKYDSVFPVVVKAASSSASAGVFLARNKEEYDKIVRKAGKVIVAGGLADLFTGWIKTQSKRLIKAIDPSKNKYYWKYNTTPLSMPLVVQPFVDGLEGDFKVLFFGGKYFSMYRKNRENDFRASGSGSFLGVPDDKFDGLLNFARKVTEEINFPMIGMDIGFDGKEYHLIEFQMIDMGTSALQRSEFWHEFKNGKLLRFDGKSDLEEEFSRSVLTFITER
jgi:glutathione synthase/RimK-type ligase-like ATP-grasp enzyme